MGFLEKKSVRSGNHTMVIPESRLVNGKKYTGKHTRMGNAPAKENWYNLLDWLMDAPVSWNAAHKCLVCLAGIDGGQSSGFVHPCILVRRDISFRSE
jgi:hypothetical protein